MAFGNRLEGYAKISLSNLIHRKSRRMTNLMENWRESLADALAGGQQIAPSVEDFNLASEHIVRLLTDASNLLEDGSHGTAAFLAITALEETAKVHIGPFRRGAAPIKRGKDPLYQHGKKHRLALGPTVAMGSRLQDAIGATRMHELISLAHTGAFIALRESSLYLEQDGQTLNVPLNVVSRATARDLLLLSIEAFDDGLVGYTNRSFELAEETDSIFEQWANEAGADQLAGSGGE